MTLIDSFFCATGSFLHLMWKAQLVCVLINGENLSVGQRTMLGNRDQLNTINFGWTAIQFGS